MRGIEPGRTARRQPALCFSRRGLDLDSSRGRGATGLPVGIKSAVGNMEFWDDLVADHGLGHARRRLRQHRRRRGRDRRGADGLRRRRRLPLPGGVRPGLQRFAGAGLADDVTFIGAGKLGIPENAVVAFALGADMVNVGREAMLSIGCIQAQKCHTDHCPVGVATQNPRYTRGWTDPEERQVRQLRRTCAATCSRSPRLFGVSTRG